MTLSPKARVAFAGRLLRAIEGDLLFDEFSRGQYATDASPYETFPTAVVLPKSQDDILAAMHVAWESGVPVIARGGGTGRVGQAVGEGLIIDFSKYLTRLLYYDASAQTCIAEPGITPAALNEALKPERVWFPVEIASAAQATIGGMVATDAIGRRALLYGRMRDNIVACDAILAHGAEISFHQVSQNFGQDNAASEDTALVLDLLEAAQNNEDVICALHTVIGTHPGYNLKSLLPENSPQNLAAFLAGSEGTLAVAKRIELKLARRPASRALGICHFSSLGDAIHAAARVVALQPIDIELTNRRILELGLKKRQSGDLARRVSQRDMQVLLFVEFMEGNRVKNAKKLKDLADLMAELGHARAVTELLGSAAQDSARRTHCEGLAQLYAMTTAPAAFVPIGELALPLNELSDISEGIAAVFARRGLDVIWHGQVGAGAVHIRPWLNRDEGAFDVSDIAREVQEILNDFAGRYTSVEGYGIGRSLPFEAMRDHKLTRLFEDIKTRFDPQNRLNPGKIVGAAKPIAEMLRRKPQSETKPSLSALNCDGTAVCRRLDKSVMCPSFKVTRNERDSPRGRANTIRLAISGQLGAEALVSDAMAQTMALCVSCKACRSECPRSVDVAQARIAVQAERVRRSGLSKFEESVAYLPRHAPRLRPWRHVLNLRDLLPWTAAFSQKLTGISAIRPWPRWSAAPFSGNKFDDGQGVKEIVLFPDTFNNYFDSVTLRSAADVLSASGFRLNLLLPPKGERPYCCGRTFLEVGLLDEARTEARRLINAAAPFIERGAALVGLEPACLLTIRDELTNTLGETGAQDLAAASFLFEEVMSQPGLAAVITPKLLKIETEALFAAHCHQHAFGTADLGRRVAAMVPGINVIEADKSCCGMGTLFGYQPDNVAMSFKMGEISLFPQIRRASRDTLLIADGFACRKQINDGTGRTARHTAVLLKLALAAKEEFGRNDGEPLEDGLLPKRLSRLRRHYFK